MGPAHCVAEDLISYNWSDMPKFFGKGRKQKELIKSLLSDPSA
jgi:hypothetical protein